MLDVDSNARISGDVAAANNVKEWDSGWFPISGLAVQTKDHTLGVIPKLIQVWCAESATPTAVSLAGPFHVEWAATDRGPAVYNVTAQQITVRAGNDIGRKPDGSDWLTSGYYKIVAWAEIHL